MMSMTVIADRQLINAFFTVSSLWMAGSEHDVRKSHSRAYLADERSHLTPFAKKDRSEVQWAVNKG
eukprot:scaffold508504_cov15-Prasinocladus_malaysianus.AAC.1